MTSPSKGKAGRPGVPPEKVIEAAEALRKRTGKIPTIEQVRLELGTGSPNTICKIMKSWRASLEPAVPVTAASDQITKMLKALAEVVSTDVTRQFQERIEQLTADNATLLEENERLEEDAAERQAQLETTSNQRDLLAVKEKEGSDEVARLRLESVRDKSTIALLELERNSLLDRSVSAEQERQAASERIKELRNELARSRSERDSLAEQLEGAFVQLSESEQRQRAQPRRPLVAVRRSASTPVSLGAIGRGHNRLQAIAAASHKAEERGAE